MTKVAYNACFGGFGLSDDALEALLDRKGIAWDKSEGSGSMGSHYKRKDADDDSGYLLCYNLTEDRTDPDLIAVIEALGDKANGMCAKLRIEELPEGAQYRIDEYDGNETVATRDSYDWQTA